MVVGGSSRDDVGLVQRHTPGDPPMRAAVLRQVVTEPTDVELARAAFKDLERWILSPETLALTLDEVEREEEKKGREVQRLMLQAHMNQRGPGDVGPAIEVLEGEGRKKCSRRHGERRWHRRRVLTIFGALVLHRLAYHADEAESVHPLDEKAELPERTFSYEVQRRLVLAMVQGPYREAVERLDESTGLTISKKSAEEILQDAARDFDAFYEGRNRSLPPPSKTGLILVAGVDCKGVPMLYEEDLRVVTRGKNERDNKKRMATVAAVFTQAPRVRTPEEVVESLFRKNQASSRRTTRRHAGPARSTSESGRASSRRRTRCSQRSSTRSTNATRRARRS